MNVDGAKGRRLVGVFLLGFVLLNYPILSLFNLEKLLFGIPLLYCYMFFVWSALIGLIVFITSLPDKSNTPNRPNRGF